jgi:hypothetical protein
MSSGHRRPNRIRAAICSSSRHRVWGSYSNADALVDVARVLLNAAPRDRSGEDRTLVVVHVSAELARNVAAGTPGTADAAEADQDPADRTDGVGNVPAGTARRLTEAICHIAGVGSVEAATAQLHACDNPVLGAILDKHGKVLALGRSRRLVSKRSVGRC